MRKIVFVIGIMGNGGAERVIATLSNYLSKKNYDISIITIYGDRTDYQLEENVKHLPIICKSKNKIFRPIERIRIIKQNLKAINPDCVISFLTDVNIHTLFATRGLNIPLILSERNDPNNDPSIRWQRVIRNKIYRWCDGIVFQTNDAMGYFKNYLPSKVKRIVIPNPVSSQLPYHLQDEKCTRFITACRLNKQKNLPLMIDAVSELVKKGYDCTLDIFGDGPLKPILEDYIHAINLSDRIKLKGFSTNIHKEMTQSLAFVISSNYEGISNSMLEALAIGVPVIATDCPIGGAKDSIENGVNGFLVPVGDKDSLVSAMERVLNSDKLRKQIGSEAMKIREKLSVEVIGECWHRFIEENIMHLSK